MSDSLILVCGDEPFLIEEHVATVKHTYQHKTADQLNATITFDDLIQRLSGTGLFSSANLFILKNPPFLSQALSDQDLDQFKTIINELTTGPHTLLIIQQGSIDNRKKLIKLIKSSGTIKQFSAFKDWDQSKVLDCIPPMAQKYGKAITRDATLVLEQIHGHNLQHIKQDIEALVTYIGNETTISDKDVIAMSAPLASSAYKFSEAMKHRHVSQMISLSKRLLDSGDDPIRFLGLVASNLRLYCQLFLGLQTKTVDQVASDIGKNPYFLKKVWEVISRTYTKNDVLSFFNHLATLDIEIKSGKKKPIYGIELMFLSLQK